MCVCHVWPRVSTLCLPCLRSVLCALLVFSLTALVEVFVWGVAVLLSAVRLVTFASSAFVCLQTSRICTLSFVSPFVQFFCICIVRLGFVCICLCLDLFIELGRGVSLCSVGPHLTTFLWASGDACCIRF